MSLEPEPAPLRPAQTPMALPFSCGSLPAGHSQNWTGCPASSQLLLQTSCHDELPGRAGWQPEARQEHQTLPPPLYHPGVHTLPGI